jgi:hypothetical protein
MPTSAEILARLTAIANQHLALAILWHAVALCVAAALLWGWRPARRLAAVLLAVPLIWVAALAFQNGTPFNGVILGGLVVVMAGLGMIGGREPVSAGPRWAIALGAVLIGFAWIYPHFLDGEPWYAYLYAAPLGLLPCPTLSMLVGVALIGGGLGSRPWRGALAAVALFYGLFGAFRLGVTMDLVLAAGGLALAGLAVAPRRSFAGARGGRPIVRGVPAPISPRA